VTAIDVGIFCNHLLKRALSSCSFSLYIHINISGEAFLSAAALIGNQNRGEKI
jgi:hypothetical protein